MDPRGRGNPYRPAEAQVVAALCEFGPPSGPSRWRGVSYRWQPASTAGNGDTNRRFALRPWRGEALFRSEDRRPDGRRALASAIACHAESARTESTPSPSPAGPHRAPHAGGGSAPAPAWTDECGTATGSRPTAGSRPPRSAAGPSAPPSPLLFSSPAAPRSDPDRA